MHSPIFCITFRSHNPNEPAATSKLFPGWGIKVYLVRIFGIDIVLQCLRAWLLKVLWGNLYHVLYLRLRRGGKSATQGRERSKGSGTLGAYEDEHDGGNLATQDCAEVRVCPTVGMFGIEKGYKFSI
jgi:hypothetical protein